MAGLQVLNMVPATDFSFLQKLGQNIRENRENRDIRSTLADLDPNDPTSLTETAARLYKLGRPGIDIADRLVQSGRQLDETRYQRGRTEKAEEAQRQGLETLGKIEPIREAPAAPTAKPAAAPDPYAHLDTDEEPPAAPPAKPAGLFSSAAEAAAPPAPTRVPAPSLAAPGAEPRPAPPPPPVAPAGPAGPSQLSLPPPPEAPVQAMAQAAPRGPMVRPTPSGVRPLPAPTMPVPVQAPPSGASWVDTAEARIQQLNLLKASRPDLAKAIDGMIEQIQDKIKRYREPEEEARKEEAASRKESKKEDLKRRGELIKEASEQRSAIAETAPLIAEIKKTINDPNYRGDMSYQTWDPNTKQYVTTNPAQNAYKLATQVNAWAKFLGIDKVISTDDMYQTIAKKTGGAGMERIQAVMKELALKNAQLFKGNFSDRDREFVTKMSINPDISVNGVKQFIDAIERAHKRAAERNDIVTRSTQADKSATQIEQRLQNYDKRVPLNPKEPGPTGPAEAPTARAAPAPAPARQAPATPKVNDVIDGYRFKGGDPSKRSNWERAEGT